MQQKSILANKNCLKLLSTGLGLGVFYALFIVAAPWLTLELPVLILILFWAIIKAILGVGLICLYKSTQEKKVAFAGILMLTSAFFSPFPINTFLSLAVEALALTSLSLTLYDINKAFPGLKLSVSAGVIFLGVIFSMLNSEMMLSLASFAWLFGFLFSSSQVLSLTRLRLKK